MVFKNFLGYEKIFSKILFLLKKDKLPPVFLLKGRESLGKKEFAKKISALFFCKDRNACGQCPQCNLAGEDKHPYILNFDCKESLDKSHIMLLQEHLSVVSAGEFCQARVVVLGDVDYLHVSLVNKLLKTLESTEKNCYVILTSSRPKLILATLLSRCVEFYIKPPEKGTLLSYFSKCSVVEKYSLSNSYLESIIKEQGLSPGRIIKFLDDYCSDKKNQDENLYSSLFNSEDNHKVFEIADEIAKKKDLSIYDIINNLEIEINKSYNSFVKEGNFSKIDYCKVNKRRNILQFIKKDNNFLKVAFNKRLLLGNIAIKR
jgi:DNA polymerase III delta prime subunit